MPGSSLKNAALKQFEKLLASETGLEFTDSRRQDLEHAIVQTMRELEITKTPDLIKLLSSKERTDTAWETFIDKVTVGESHFFRNQAHFEALEKHILPAIIARRREERRIRIWSAGCASGEEPYSLAIMLEQLLPNLGDWVIFILATDINLKALEKAENGIYGVWSFRQLPQSIQTQYFNPQGERFQIARRFQERVVYAPLNLVRDDYPSLLNSTASMDLILCRNVLLYFAKSTAAKVISRLHDSLAEGGWLIVGHSDYTQSSFRQFEAHQFPETIVYRKKGAKVSETAKPVSLPDPSWEAAEVKTGEVTEQDMAIDKEESANEETSTPDWLSAYESAKLYADRMEFEMALHRLQGALERAPMEPLVHYLHAMILQEIGQTEEALAALRRCVYSDPEFALGHFALAVVQKRLKLDQRAHRSLENAAQLLTGRNSDEQIQGADGMTVGHLRELIRIREQMTT